MLIVLASLAGSALLARHVKKVRAARAQVPPSPAPTPVAEATPAFPTEAAEIRPATPAPLPLIALPRPAVPMETLLRPSTRTAPRILSTPVRSLVSLGVERRNVLDVMPSTPGAAT